MGSKVGCAKLLGPPASKRLALVASGKECQFFRVAIANIAQPIGGEIHRLVPLNFLEFTFAAFAGS